MSEVGRFAVDFEYGRLVVYSYRLQRFYYSQPRHFELDVIEQRQSVGRLFNLASCRYYYVSVGLLGYLLGRDCDFVQHHGSSAEMYGA